MKNRPERAVVRVAWLILKFYTPWNISGTAKARDQILYTGWPCEVLAFGRVSLTVHWCGQRTRRRSACGLHLRRSSASWLNAQVYYTLVDCNPLIPLLRYVLDLSYKLVLHCYSWQDSDWHIPSRGPSAVAELLAKSVVKLSIAHPCRSKTQLGLYRRLWSLTSQSSCAFSQSKSYWFYSLVSTASYTLVQAINCLYETERRGARGERCSRRPLDNDVVNMLIDRKPISVTSMPLHRAHTISRWI